MPDEKAGSVAEMDAEFNLDDLMDDEAVKKAKEDGDLDDIGKVTFGDDESYMQFEAPVFTLAMKPFMARKSAGKDVIARSVLMETLDDHVQLYAMDSTSFLRAKVPAKQNKFPEDLIFNIESVYRVAMAQRKYSYLIMDEGKLMADFFGGRIFIPTVRLDKKLYKRSFGEVKSEFEITPERFLIAFRSLLPVVTETDVPELSFLFFSETGALATNGNVVAKVEGIFPKVALRKKDLEIISLLVERSAKEEIMFNEYDEYYQVQSDSFEYTFPKVITDITKDYEAMIESVTGYFFIDVQFLLNIIGVLSHLPEDSGIITFIFTAEELKGEAMTKRGDMSTFNISTSKEGAPKETKVSLNLKALLNVLRVFKSAKDVKVGIGEKSIQFFVDDRKASVLFMG